MKKSVYLDATIPSYYFDERNEIGPFVDITKKWWDTQRENFQIYISDYTLTELQQKQYPNKDKIIELVSNIESFEFSDEIDSIAEIYINQFVMPKGDFGDAFHLACASLNKIDYLLTWNCNHLANANKEEHIQIVNGKLGIHTPIICTPLQLFMERD